MYGHDIFVTSQPLNNQLHCKYPGSKNYLLIVCVMSKALLYTLFFVFAASSSFAQVSSGPHLLVGNAFVSTDTPAVNLPGPPLPLMAPELALQMYEQRTAEQDSTLAEYSDQMVVEAELPDTSQKGEYELVRNYSARPRQLSFRTVKYTGDSFVKTNVITRFLQSEVDHVQKGDPAASAINEKNYKIAYKGTEDLDGRLTHVYQLKPRHKSPNLFKGKIYVDAYTGSLRRAEGTVSKSPSFFIRKIEFVQDFEDINGFTVPVAMRSTAKARIIGRAIVSVFHRGYNLKPAPAPVNAMMQETAKSLMQEIY